MVFSLFGKKSPPPVVPPVERRSKAAQPKRAPAGRADDLPDAPVGSGLRLEIGASGIDPCVEHAAILYSADRPGEARAVLEAALAQGDAPEESWLMLLELYELAGDAQRGNALALSYTARFKKPPPRQAVAGQQGGPRLSGQIVAATSGSFDFLLTAAGAELEIDASGLLRMDFVSAGVLLNTMLALHKAGKRVRIRQLSHLVAGLLASVGMGRTVVLETR